jgi:hypothetical protein
MTTKLCKDCRFHHENKVGPKYAQCHHDRASDPSGGARLAEWLVTGEGERPEEKLFYYCSTMRECNACSIAGRLWEPKEGAVVLAAQAEPEIGGAK